MLSGQEKLFFSIPCILVKENSLQNIPTYIVDTLTYVKQMSKCVWICWANSFLGFGVVQFVGEACQHIKIGPRASHHIHAH